MRTLLTALTLGMALLLAACAEETDDRSDAVTQTDETVEETVETTDDAERGDDATADTVSDAMLDEDPRQVVVELRDTLADREFEATYERIVPNFHLLEYDESWVEPVLRSHLINLYPAGTRPDPGDLPATPDAWDAEEHEDFVVVRNPEIPANAVVLRPVNGEWRWDPGPHSLALGWATTISEDLDESIRVDPFMQREHPRYTVPDFENDIDVDEHELRPFQYFPRTFALDDDLAELTVALSPVATGPRQHIAGHLRADSLIPLDGLSWEAGGETGSVEVVWTTALLEDDNLLLPGLPEGIDPLQAYYKATLKLVDFPRDVEQITVTAEDIQVGPMGEDSPVAQDEPFSVDISHTFTAETSAEILLGQVPDIEIPDVPEPDQAIPHVELPANTIDDAFAVTEVEHDRTESAVQAYVRVETSQLPPSGGDGVLTEGMLTWDDGHQSEARIVWSGDVAEFRGRRTEQPLDARVTEITFLDQMVRYLGPDEDATLHEDRIETKWGDFPILDISEVLDDAIFVHYQPAGRRVVGRVQIGADEQPVSLIRPASPGDDYEPSLVDRRVTGPGLIALTDELPLPATVQVIQVDTDPTMTVD